MPAPGLNATIRKGSSLLRVRNTSGRLWVPNQNLDSHGADQAERDGGRWGQRDKGTTGRRYESEPSGTQKVAPTILSEPTRPGRRRARLERVRPSSRRKAESLGMIAQQLEIDARIIVDEKHVLPVVPTLGHVVRLTRDNDSSNTTHAETLPDPPPMVKKYVTVPGCTARAAWLTHVPERTIGGSSGGQRLSSDPAGSADPDGMLRRNGESLFPRRRGQDCNDGAATQERIAARRGLLLESSRSFGYNRGLKSDNWEIVELWDKENRRCKPDDP